MAYVVPARFAQGDYPTAANFNKYKSGLDDIYARTGSAFINPTVCFREGGIQNFFIVHIHRWLLYRGDGTLQDPSGAGDDVSLSMGAVSSDWKSLDLLQVDWLVIGKAYEVQNVDACFEDFESL